MNVSTAAESLKQFYVYELQDPITDKVFYVGKGTSRRAWAHLKTEILEEGEQLGEKQRKIADLRREHGREPRIVIVGRFDTHEEALAVECVLIKWIYDIENLVNIVHGHRHRFVRAKGQLGHLTGIDEEARERSGEYTATFNAAAIKHDIPGQQRLLIEWFRQISPGIAISEPVLSQSPNFSVAYNADFRLRIILSAKGTGYRSVSLTPAAGAREKWSAFQASSAAKDLFGITKGWAWVKPKVDATTSSRDAPELVAILRRYGDALSILGENPEIAFATLID